MTQKQFIKIASNTENNLEIREKATGKTGVVSYNGKVCCFFGNDDGSDDCRISVKEFFERFEIVNEKEVV